MSVSTTGHVRRIAYNLRTEGGGPVREATAIGAGVFIGCTPFYGFHLLLCFAAGWLFGLNRLKLYLAANVSNPLMAPFLLIGELQAGALMRRGDWHALTVETVRTVDPWVFGADVLVGSLIVGSLLGAAAGLATWAATRGRDDEGFGLLVRRASDRYVGTSFTAWEFARGKLRGDPLYRTILTGGVLPPGGTLVEVGCGQGLMLALLAEASHMCETGEWPPALPSPPRFEALVGIETRSRVASLARRALVDAATIVDGDAREHKPSRCRAVLFFDVLQMMPFEHQLQLLTQYSQSLEPGGVILVREADASAGWRFTAVRAGNRAKALAFGNWKQTFHFRTASDWHAVFERLGFAVSRFETCEGTPFGNVLFVLSDRRRPSA